MMMEKIFKLQTIEIRLQSRQETTMNLMLFILLDGSFVNVLPDISAIKRYICWETMSFRFYQTCTVWNRYCLQKVQGRKKKIDISVEKHVFGTLFGEKQLLCTVYILLNFQSEINLFSSEKIIFLVSFLNNKHIVYYF